MEPRDCPEVSAVSSELESLIHRCSSPWWPEVMRGEGSGGKLCPDADGREGVLPNPLHPTGGQKLLP
ncbi:hypothetical protein GDO81_011926 [Engystomops pustulosus]|uniref:Uncharacterized protein n=1 Tax=Engystomops pustulosus TaxID=76066 RepID=A0AAV7BHQ5_ENGPU|nr:hypothetical protein GDO81_011926 [Engystomops pustulosus]